MENIVSHLEELNPESNITQQRSLTAGGNKMPDVQTKCDSTVPENPRPAAEADDIESEQRMIANVSSSSSGLVSVSTSISPSSEDLLEKPQADKSRKMHQAGEDSQVVKLTAEVNSLRDDLRRSDELVVLLRRHIELNTTAEGAPQPTFSPDIIVALAQEVERLNAELEKVSAEGRSKERAVELTPETEPQSGDVPSASGGRQEIAKHEVQSTGSQSVQSLDSTLTDVEAATADPATKRQSAGVDNEEPCDELTTKGALVSHDGATARDEAAVSAIPSSAAAFNIPGDQRSFLGSPSTRNMLRQSMLFSHSPFNSANAANQRAFAELQAEVERLRRRLELTELENSRLLEHSARESVGSFTGAATAARPSISPQAEVSLSLDGSLVKYSASGDVTMAAGFLKKLINTHRRDRAYLQRHLAASYETVHLLHTRMEELVRFMEDLLSVTPAQGHKQTEHMRSRLNETLELLAEVATKYSDYDTEDVSDEMSNLELELSSLVDLDLTSALNDGSELVSQDQAGQAADTGLVQTASLDADVPTAQQMINSLSQKLKAANEDAFSSRCRISELSRDLESVKKSLSERETKLDKYEQQSRDLALRVRESDAQADELQSSLAKAQTKNEELSKIKREIEVVLVEQEKQITMCEDQMKQMMIERNNETELAREREAELERLREEAQNQQKKIEVLDALVRQLRDQLEQERCAAVTIDDSRRSGLQDRDAMIAKLKALVRENQSTADRVREELSRMNEEAKDKNWTIAKLRRRCEELSGRCSELEAALCRTSLDITGVPLTPQSRHSAADFRDSLDKARSVGSATSVELMRHAQDYDEQNVDLWRQRHISATQVSAPSYVADGSTAVSDAAGYLAPNHAAASSNLPRSKSAETLTTQAADDAFAAEMSERTASEALSTARQQLLSAELELSSLKQRLEEATAVSQALRLELQLCQHLTRTLDDDKENHRGVGVDSAASSGDLAAVLGEVNRLRVQLERCISSNDQLRHTLRKCGSIPAHLDDSNYSESAHRPGAMSGGVLNTASSVDASVQTQLQPTSSAAEHVTDNMLTDDVAAAAGKLPIVLSEMLSAVVTESDLEQLKAGIERCHTTLAQLDSAVRSLPTQFTLHTPQADGADVDGLLNTLWQSVRSIVDVVCSFQLTTDIHSQAALISSLRKQNTSLRRQVAELQQRYTHAKQAMKQAQERLDAHSRRKEELMRQQRKNNDTAIIAEINKTRQVLAATSHNLESYHHSSAATEKPDVLQK